MALRIVSVYSFRQATQTTGRLSADRVTENSRWDLGKRILGIETNAQSDVHRRMNTSELDAEAETRDNRLAT